MTDPKFALGTSIFFAWCFFMFVMLFGSSIVYSFRKYCEMRATLKARSTKRRSFRRRLVRSMKLAALRFYRRITIKPAKKKEPDFSLWETAPSYRVALRHRCFKSRGRRIVVADYSDGKSAANLIVGTTNRQRIPLKELETSPESDIRFVNQSDDLRRARENPPVSRIPQPDLANFVRVGKMSASNRWIWRPGAFDHLTDKPGLLNFVDQRRAA